MAASQTNNHAPLPVFAAGNMHEAMTQANLKTAAGLSTYA